MIKPDRRRLFGSSRGKISLIAVLALVAMIVKIIAAQVYK